MDEMDRRRCSLLIDNDSGARAWSNHAEYTPFDQMFFSYSRRLFFFKLFAIRRSTYLASSGIVFHGVIVSAYGPSGKL
eukprot:4140743-Amphidinium_carterae.1